MTLKKFFKDKRVFVTGNSGFKGAWLVQILLNWGADVSGLSLPPSTEPNLFSILNHRKNIRNHQVDIRDYEKVKNAINLERPEIIIHLAAQAIVRDSYDDPLYTFSTNAMGMANVLQAVKEVGGVKSLVLITTDKVYDNKESIYPYREVDPLGGFDPYSASKAAADIIASSYIKSFFNINDYGTKHSTLVAIARAGNVIGGGDWAKNRIIPDIFYSIFKKDQPIVLRNPDSMRPWEHVLEPLSGYLLLAKQLYEGNTDSVGPWNFGPKLSNYVTVKELTQSAINYIGKGSILIQSDDTKHETNLLTLDISKSRKQLGWKPKLSFRKTIQYTFSWYKSFYESRGGLQELTDRQIRLFFGGKRLKR